MTRKTKNIFIYPDFQYKFIGIILFSGIVAVIAFYLGQKFFFKQLYLEGLRLNLADDHVYFKLLVSNEKQLNIIFYATSLFVASFSIIFGSILSHKIAGPIIRLNSYFKDLAEGREVDELKFRDNDLFLDVPKSINSYLQKFRKNNKY